MRREERGGQALRSAHRRRRRRWVTRNRRASKGGFLFFFFCFLFRWSGSQIVVPSTCGRFKCPARCEERENPSPLSHDPTLATYQVRMPASLVVQPSRSRSSSHQRGASWSRDRCRFPLPTRRQRHVKRDCPPPWREARAVVLSFVAPV